MVDTRHGFIAGIDAGGTTFKCGLAQPDGRIIAKQEIPTTQPAETIAACAAFLKAQGEKRGGPLLALGIASFGPVDIDPLSDTYGTILKTPKAGWSQTDLRRGFAGHMPVPVRIDTDVNAALLGEVASGAARDADAAAYVTVGTGIGAGIHVAAGLVGKPKHPEFGHIRVQRHPEDAAFKGVCPFHADCLEGLASATAFTARHGNPAELAPDHPGWDMQAFYLGQACLSLHLSLRLDRIILGGGLMRAPSLLALVRRQYLELAGGYLGETHEDVERMIVLPGHGPDAGLMGGVYLARSLIGERPVQT